MFEVPEITSKRQWHAQLKAAKLKHQALREGPLPWTVVSVIEGRLNGMQAVAESGAAPSPLDRERGMSLGVIALHIYPLSREYCRLLLQLASGFEHWTALPDELTGQG